jgi:hypothetical protein
VVSVPGDKLRKPDRCEVTAGDRRMMLERLLDGEVAKALYYHFLITVGE